MSKHQRYQDYVIKDGTFVGEFEEMYKDFDDPWDQSFRESGVLSKFVIEKILENWRITRPYEIGCGLGYFVELMRVLTGTGGAWISLRRR